MSADQHESMRGELLEYLYGCHPDPDAIERTLASDPKIAALLEEVRTTKSVLDRAARGEVGDLHLAPLAGQTTRLPALARGEQRLEQTAEPAGLVVPWAETTELAVRAERACVVVDERRDEIVAVVVALLA